MDPSRHPTGTDAPTCVVVREALSARHDGQAAPSDPQAGALLEGEPTLERDPIDDHVQHCDGCAVFAEGLAGVDALVVRAASMSTPRSTGSILTAVTEQQRRDAAVRPTQLRWIVGFAGVVQLILAVPILVGLVGPDVHAGRDLGALRFAIGVGLVLAAWQPRRAAGVLPVAAVVAAITVVVAMIDVAAGVASVGAELTHLAEVVGVLALWAFVRQAPPEVPAARPVAAW